MKRSHLIIIALSIAAIVGFALIYGGMFHAMRDVVEGGENCSEEEILSENGEYLLCISHEDSEGTASMSFDIKDAEDGTMLYTCPDAYRAYDLKGIEWDGIDVIVKSADVGTYRYVYSDGSWNKK